MPRIRQYEARYRAQDLMSAIWAAAAADGCHNLKQMSDRTGIPYTTLRTRAANPLKFTLDEVSAIVSAFGMNTDAVAAAIKIRKGG